MTLSWRASQLFFSYRPPCPPAMFPFVGSSAASQPPAVFHPARSAVESFSRQQREAGGEASRLTSLTASNELHSFRSGNIKILASVVILGFLRRMRFEVISGSKWCAVRPRHTQDRRISSARLRSTWKGGHPHFIPRCRRRHAETRAGFRAFRLALRRTTAAMEA